MKTIARTIERKNIEESNVMKTLNELNDAAKEMGFTIETIKIESEENQTWHFTIQIQLSDEF